MDNTLLLQWVFGSIVVYLYARDRFDNPGPMRFTTTFARYWIARVGYIFSMVTLFLILGGAVTDLDLNPLWKFLGVPNVVKDPAGLPGPLLAALLLTSLLPHFPYLSKIDDAVKMWFQRVGNIPFEVRELSGRLQDAKLSISPSLMNKLRPVFHALRINEHWLSAPEHSFKHRWARTAALYALIKPWPQSPGYSRYVHEQIDRFNSIKERVEALEGLTDQTLTDLDQVVEGVARDPLRRSLPKDIDKLHESLCDFISGGLLHSEWNPNQRYAMLEKLGFGGLQRPRHALTAHEVFLVAGLIFLSMMFVTLISRRFLDPAPLALNVRVLVMTPIIYAVAIVAAIYPKAVWKFADIRAVGQRPVAGYAASGLLAVGAAFFISLLFRFALGEEPGNLFEVLSSPGRFRAAMLMTMDRWPWLLMTFFNTVAIAWAADNHYSAPENAPGWLRRVEAGGLALVFGGMQWMVVELLAAGSTDPARWLDKLGQMILTAMLVGGCIGYLVPHLYRAKCRVSRRASASSDVSVTPVRSDESDTTQPLTPSSLI